MQGKESMINILHHLGMGHQRLIDAVEGDAYDGVSLDMDTSDACVLLRMIAERL